MIMYEQDPDVVRWGLHNLLHGDPFSSSTGYCEPVATHNVVTFHDGLCVHEDAFGFDRNMVQNDEILARALQQEFSELAAAESSGKSGSTGQQWLQTSVLAQDWFGPTSSSRDLSSGNECLPKPEDMEPSGSRGSLEEKKFDGEEWSLQLAEDFFTVDCEVGKKFNQMVPVPHVPRINGDIPSVDEATSDHQRLLDRLQLYDLVEHKTLGDGNCQFRALSDQFYRTSDHHDFVREQVVNQLTAFPELYDGYVPMAYDDYLKKMAKSGEWGDHVTLQAAADSYGVMIFVMTSFKDTCYIEILPNVPKSKRVIFLSFWSEVHYNSIYPEGELPYSESLESRRKKKWWHFGNSRN